MILTSVSNNTAIIGTVYRLTVWEYAVPRSTRSNSDLTDVAILILVEVLEVMVFIYCSWSIFQQSELPRSYVILFVSSYPAL